MSFIKNRKVLVKDILELDTFSDCKIVAGINGLSNEINSITVAEVPDASNWLIGGELVVSTGYYIRDNEEIQKEWMQSLINKGASALAIKPERFLGKTTEQLKEIADKHLFPLIELPQNIVWPDIIQSVTEKLQAHQHQIISRTEDIHNSLTELVLNGGGVNEIAQTLSNLVNTPTIVEDCQLNILSIRTPKQSIEDYEVLLDYRKSSEYRKKFKNSVAYRESITERHKNLFSMHVDINGYGRISQKVMPIVANKVLYGFLSAIETNDKQINEIDILALEHGTTTIALDMLMERIKIESTNRAKSTLMNELLKGDMKIAVSSYMNYKITSYDILNPSVVLIIKIRSEDQLWIDKSNERLFIDRYDKKFTKVIEKYFKQLDYDSFVDLQGNHCTILLPYPHKSNRVTYMNVLKEYCDKLLRKLLEEFPQNAYVIGIGEPYFHIEGLKKAYQKAETAMQLAQKFFGYNYVSVYNELGILKLLSLIENQSEVENFCIELIGNLIEYDKKHNDNMCEVLSVYLDNNGNNSETARALYIHPNTLNYRIKKISKLLGLDLSNSQVRFNLYLALSIKKIFMEESIYINNISDETFQSST